MLPITEADPGDAKALSALHQACFIPGWDTDAISNLFSANHARAFGVQSEGHWIAFALVSPCVDDVELLTIATHPDHRGQGLARQVLGNVIVRYRFDGFKRILLEVAEDNASAIRLYQGLDFQNDGRRPSHYARPDNTRVDAILMSVEL